MQFLGTVMQYLGTVMQYLGAGMPSLSQRPVPVWFAPALSRWMGKLWVVKLESGLISKQFSPSLTVCHSSGDISSWACELLRPLISISLTYMSVTQKGKYFQALKVTGNFINQDKAHIQTFLHSKMGCG